MEPRSVIDMLAGEYEAACTLVKDTISKGEKADKSIIEEKMTRLENAIACERSVHFHPMASLAESYPQSSEGIYPIFLLVRWSAGEKVKVVDAGTKNGKIWISSSGAPWKEWEFHEVLGWFEK